MIGELANHLWQSTLFAVAVGLLTVMCRKNHASVRYWLWFSASVKFFIPFTVLMALGDRLEWVSRTPQIATLAVSATLAQVSRPFVMDRVLARANGSLGPRLRQSQGPAAPAGLAAAGGQCTPPGPPGPISMRLCGVTMASLVDTFLPMYTGRTVVDRTGLTGGFDLALYFDNRPIPGVGPGGGLPTPPQAAEPAAADAVSIFTALEEQLGLKLEPQTGPAEVLVIDHVERPTAN